MVITLHTLFDTLCEWFNTLSVPGRVQCPVKHDTMTYPSPNSDICITVLYV